MRRELSAYVLDMLIAARDAVGFAEGLSFEDFTADRRTQLSIVKSIEIVGEAASRVDVEIRRAHPAIPWQDIVGSHQGSSARSTRPSHARSTSLGSSTASAAGVSGGAGAGRRLRSRVVRVARSALHADRVH